MGKIEKAREFPFPAHVLNQGIREILPLCGARIEGTRTEGGATITTAQRLMRLGAAGQYFTCRVDPIAIDSSRLTIESSYWQIDDRDAGAVVDRILTEMGPWLNHQTEAVPDEEPMAGPRRCMECGVILAAGWKYCPMCATPAD